MKKLREYLAIGIITLGAVILILSVLVVAVILFIGYSIHHKSFKRGYEEAEDMVTHFIEQIL